MDAGGEAFLKLRDEDALAVVADDASPVLDACDVAEPVVEVIFGDRCGVLLGHGWKYGRCSPVRTGGASVTGATEAG